MKITFVSYTYCHEHECQQGGLGRNGAPKLRSQSSEWQTATHVICPAKSHLTSEAASSANPDLTRKQWWVLGTQKSTPELPTWKNMWTGNRCTTPNILIKSNTKGHKRKKVLIKMKGKYAGRQSKSKTGVFKEAQQLRGLSPGTHMVEGKKQLVPAMLWPPQCPGQHSHNKDGQKQLK